MSTGRHLLIARAHLIGFIERLCDLFRIVFVYTIVLLMLSSQTTPGSKNPFANVHLVPNTIFVRSPMNPLHAIRTV